jgi:predicted GNAT family acetyltransferase
MTRPKTTAESITRHDNPSGREGTFDLSIGGKRLGHLVYSLAEKGTLTIDYVHVDPSLRGQGMGQKLVAAAVDWAREESLNVVPLCSYARAVMARAGYTVLR